ncbi:MAG: hypothetical protein ACPG2Y_02320, partial [Acholeplasmataceae bacterium]
MNKVENSVIDYSVIENKEIEISGESDSDELSTHSSMPDMTDESDNSFDFDQFKDPIAGGIRSDTLANQSDIIVGEPT